ncbi:MAG: putative membrane protein [Candidatus Methanohalarchaeum thermophilum]|uniref:Membrane protein n=1 Tax=Methanohalarchaeum thermophilum TaxID=1903181 RepID=A0A1Q6DT52_METT1|nr:MAG: putative membrane protein [Candidatus Methanohalarchaeum thermophilum]
MNYYDKLLAGIFTSMVTGGAIGLTPTIPTNLSIAIGTITATILMLHGLFKNAPITETTNTPNAQTKNPPVLATIKNKNKVN